MEYRIGVRHLFFWRVYKVVGHATETVASSARLVLRFMDGSRLAIPRIDRKAMRVYPEFQHLQDAIEQARASQPRPAFLPEE